MDVVDQIPDWVMAGVALAGCLYGAAQWFGTTKARVRAVEVEMERRKEYIYDLKNLEKEVSKMRVDVGNATVKAEETNAVLLKLAEAVDKLSIGVAKLDTQMEIFEKRLEKEEDKGH